jgi:glucose dehydrogenase
VANGIVYVGSDDYNVYALNATTGSTIWTYGTLFYVDSSPAVANGVVYVGSEDNSFYAFGTITVPQPSPVIPEFPNRAVALTLIAAMVCATFAVIVAKKKRISWKTLQC